MVLVEEQIKRSLEQNKEPHKFSQLIFNKEQNLSNGQSQPSQQRLSAGTTVAT